ncbi:hypothetical protein CK203_035010 [Vitis vinifera]|uniref:non-specific serine/threonine protein kinase n=2 Tax=Vitis vinifera TaxID=29760 RepID=A0A438I9Y6_VITVI|nr:hypothetical protein CK203_035010 [Vitis vinifera]
MTSQPFGVWRIPGASGESSQHRILIGEVSIKQQRRRSVLGYPSDHFHHTSVLARLSSYSRRRIRILLIAHSSFLQPEILDFWSFTVSPGHLVTVLTSMDHILVISSVSSPSAPMKAIYNPDMYTVDPKLQALSFEYMEDLAVKDIFLDFGLHILLKNGCTIVQSMLIQSGAYQLVFIDFGLSFMSIFPVDKADALYVHEWPLLLVHSSYENV